jgi:hypothetical protein
VGGQEADGVPEVGQLARGVLVLAGLTAALSEAAVVECQSDEAGVGEPGGIRARDLLLDARERAGEDDAGRPRTGTGRHPQTPGDLESVTEEGHGPRLHDRRMPTHLVAPATSAR